MTAFGFYLSRSTKKLEMLLCIIHLHIILGKGRECLPFTLYYSREKLHNQPKATQHIQVRGSNSKQGVRIANGGRFQFKIGWSGKAYWEGNIWAKAGRRKGRCWEKSCWIITWVRPSMHFLLSTMAWIRVILLLCKLYSVRQFNN